MGRNICRYVQWGPPHVYEMDSQHLTLPLLGLEVEGNKKLFMKETGKLFNPYLPISQMVKLIFRVTGKCVLLQKRHQHYFFISGLFHKGEKKKT